jgi:hypothetical protein
MAQTIKLKRSSTTGNVPTTSQLDLGELAINTADGKMFIKKDISGTESIVEINEVRPGAINFTVSTTAPSNPEVGDMWKDSANLKTFVRYSNGGSPLWIEI